MGGIIGGTGGQILSFFQSFANAVIAAGATILNDFMNALAGSAAHNKTIEEFSTQNTYFYTDDDYIDALHNTDKIVLNSLVRGTSVTDEIIDFYKKAYSSSDFHLGRALAIVAGTDSVHNNSARTPLSPTITCNYTLATNNNKVLPSVTLRVNNINLYEGTVAAEYAGTSGREANFTWHSVLTEGNSTPYALQSPALTSATLPNVQAATKDYLKFLGAPEPEKLLNDLPYTTSVGNNKYYRDIIDSAFINFRIKWVNGVGSELGNRISNKYLYLLAKNLYHESGVPNSLTYSTDPSNGNQVVSMFNYGVHGDGHDYTMGLSHITTSTANHTHDKYQYDKDLICSDGYYYYDAEKTLPTAHNSAKTIAEVQSYLNLTNLTSAEQSSNWLEIKENNVGFLIFSAAQWGYVNSVFPDEIRLAGSNITLKLWSAAGGYVNGVQQPDVYINAKDQVLRVGNLYKKKSSTEILFATIPASVYATSSITYGRSNATNVTYYKVFNVSAIERITDYSNNSANTEFRYISHKLDASNACVSAPIMLGVLNQLDPLEQHKLILASVNLSLHLAHYLTIETTWRQKAILATLEAVRIGAIVFSIYSLGTSSTLIVLAENVIVAYATSIAVNVFIEQILVPIIINNFGEDEALILLAAAAVTVAIIASESGTAGLNQFANQATLFAASVDIMNQMYSVAVVQPGLLEMEKEQEKLLATDNKLTEKEEELQEEMDALFGTEDSPSHLLNLQIRAALNPMPASAYASYHDNILERQFDCFDYDKYNELNVS